MEDLQPAAPREHESHDLLAARLVASAELTLEADEGSHVVVVHRASAERLKLSVALYRFLRCFATPQRVSDVAVVGSSARLLSQLRMLLDKRFLLDADAPPPLETLRLRTPVAYKFCNAPRYLKSAPATNFVILGVPYDLAGVSDCRTSAALIRQKSLDYTYERHFESQQPRGWFDANRGERILAGASLADAGDVHIECGEPQRETFMRIARVLEEICAGATIPVVLGGDRSVTCAVVDQQRRHQPLTVVQFAATPAMAAAEPAGCVAADAAGTHLARMDNVVRLISLGSESAPMRTSNSSLLSAAALRGIPAMQLIQQLAIESSVHLSIDLGVLAPPCVTSEGPPGLTLREIKELIRALGTLHRIVGIDLVGLDVQSEAAALTSIAACHLALAAMSAAHDRA